MFTHFKNSIYNKKSKSVSSSHVVGSRLNSAVNASRSAHTTIRDKSAWRHYNQWHVSPPQPYLVCTIESTLFVYFNIRLVNNTSCWYNLYNVHNIFKNTWLTHVLGIGYKHLQSLRISNVKKIYKFYTVYKIVNK